MVVAVVSHISSLVLDLVSPSLKLCTQLISLSSTDSLITFLLKYLFDDSEVFFIEATQKEFLSQLFSAFSHFINHLFLSFYDLLHQFLAVYGPLVDQFGDVFQGDREAVRMGVIAAE